ncbi:MAG: aminopeptidase family protein [Bacillales bacterium]|jgi:Xaa-Pro dipeptidase|nr:aminopeptidase family protein [Bacillales bacterium]
MSKIEKISKWLQENNIDAAFITSTENVLYLTGFPCKPHERLLAVFIFPDQDPFLIVPQLDAEDAMHSGWKYDVIGISDTENPWEKIRETIKNRYIRIDTLAIEKDHLVYNRIANLDKIFSKPMYISAEEKIWSMRMIKSNEETKKLREAARGADFAIEIGVKEIAAGKTEMQILAAIEYQLKKEGISKMSFDTMVLTGANGASPHGVPGNTKVQHGDLVMFDLGVVIDGYCSDITRTVAFGEPSEQQRAIYETVLKAQTAACNAVKPGKTCADIDLTARNIIAQAGYGEFFPHRLGHGLGMSVHESPSVTSVNQLVLQEGMVFTIEPGIYIPGIAGVRIEDDVLVTADSVEIFTQFTKELIII